MTLVHSWILHFLWILPIAGFALIVEARKKRKAMEKFADGDLLKRLAPEDHKGKRFLRGILLLFSLSALLFSLAGPRWGSHYQEVSRKGVDIMILVDVSSSMMVEDVKPNRLERARREIIDFLKVTQGDRVGLVAFSGAAFVQCPLTLDYAALQMFLSALQPGLIPVPGTDLGAALEAGLSAFDFKTETDKVMLLITDGEDNENRGLESARKASEGGVKIFVFGIGEPSGGPVPAGDGKGGFKKDKEGKLVLSKLDEDTLKDMASISGGVYVRSLAGDLDLDILYFDGIKEKTEVHTLKSGKIKVYEERFTFFALVAFLFLLLEGLIGEKVRPRFKTVFRSMILFFLYGFIQCAFATQILATEHPDELYRSGRFEEAEKAYAGMDMDNPKDIRYRYNRGCAAYQNGQYKEALASFSSVMRRAEDNDMRFKAAYNLGNTAFKQGDYQSAALYYKQALIHNPSSEDARYNLELTLKALEKLKKEKTEGPKSESQRQAADKEKDKEGEKETERDKRGEDKASQEKGPDEKSSEERENKGEKTDAHGEPEKESGQKKEEGTEKRKKPEKELTEDLSGELRPLQELPEPEKNDQASGPDGPSIDKKKAEALLDNIKENRSRFLRFVIPEEKQNGVPSGKDW
jgi:Ca-activated chloride channel family protein